MPPREQGLLAVSDDQQIYWEEWGNPDGIPALFLHGGPGGTLGTSGYRNRFDLERMRVIGYEQRGCGRSLPHASDLTTSLAANTTTHLIRDIEALRQDRGVEQWIVNGVSWGSTLALAYAQAFPERILGLVLFAVTTTSRREVDWITEGVGAVFPEAWENFASYAEQSGIGYRREDGRLVQAYASLMNSADPLVREETSHQWALWEDMHVSLGAGYAPNEHWKDDAFRLAFARLTTHYWAHDGFLEPPILSKMEKLQGISGALIHGRRDISAPAITAWELHRSWPESTLFIDEQDGHGGEAMVQAWSEANRELVRRFPTAKRKL